MDSWNRVETIMKMLHGQKAFTPDVEKEAKNLIDILIRENGCDGGLGVSEKERVEIVKAIGLSRGHWYKCPNNHVYVIGECGGAMETSKCPECHANIGGTSHRLTAGNDLAPEMDGATRSAYGEDIEADMAMARRLQQQWIG